jgi:hypothetical protein
MINISFYPLIKIQYVIIDLIGKILLILVRKIIMNNSKKLTVFSLIFILITLISCSQPENIPGQKSFKEKELEKAIFFAQANLDSLGDAGYVKYTPTTAAIQLVNTMNAAQNLTPEEEKEYRERGMPIMKGIPYALNQPTEPWQVVIVGDDAQKKVKFLGYGHDLKTPLITQEVPCCGY